eukprot:11307700-Prorocentrum_lima.AAC.1
MAERQKSSSNFVVNVQEAPIRVGPENSDGGVRDLQSPEPGKTIIDMCRGGGDVPENNCFPVAEKRN